MSTDKSAALTNLTTACAQFRAQLSKAIPDATELQRAVETLGEFEGLVTQLIKNADDERQAFIDRAAIAIMPHCSNGPARDARLAYDYAEALWIEREKRRAAGKAEGL